MKSKMPPEPKTKAPRKIQVAIVEDDREVRESLERLLNNHSQIQTAAVCESGEKAMQTIPKNQPDVVLMDIKLPGMSGIQCAAKLKDLLPRTHILMLTAYSDNDNIFEALKAGASGYLLKNIPATELSESIINVVQGGAPMTGQIARRVIEAFRRPSAPGGQEADLTAREKEILQLLARGYANKEIAARLELSTGTVRNHIAHIYEKMHVRCRAEATAKYLMGGAEPTVG